MRLRRLAAVAVLASAMAGSATAASAAEPPPNENYLTDVKYDAVTFGMSRQQVEDLMGPDPHCSGGAAGLMCWTSNASVDQTATFVFNGSGQLYKKEKGYSFAYGWYTYDLPRTMTRTQYDGFAEGDLLADVNAVTDGTACTDIWVEQPNYPSSEGWKTMVQCAGTIDESYPTIEFFFTDGRLTSKTYLSRDGLR